MKLRTYCMYMYEHGHVCIIQVIRLIRAPQVALMLHFPVIHSFFPPSSLFLLSIPSFTSCINCKTYM